MSIQLFVAIAAIFAGLVCFVKRESLPFAVGGWLILAGILWIIGGFVK